LREATEPVREVKSGPITTFLIAIVLVGIVGLSLILGGVIALNESRLPESTVGFFMFFSFIIVAITELILGRQLSRLISSNQQKVIASPPRPALPAEFQPAQLRSLSEPVASVTENTTRTLGYSRNEPLK
jgi:hypothetical protein